MRVYTVHLKPEGEAGAAVLVKEGFAWPALFLGPLWSLYRRLWLASVLWIAVLALLAFAARAAPGMAFAFAAAWLAFAVLFAAEANDARRRALGRRGWREAGVVGGAGRDAAARRFADLAAIGRG
ncbi:MAG: DUF2628 domain-containing protein [Rhodospirillales bacterium]